MNQIFISIAAFCDPLLVFTVQNAYQNATHPENLVFGIVNQDKCDTTVKKDIREAAPNSQIRYVAIDPIDSRGVCWARSLCASFYEGEDYFLQVDSHTLFDPGWDNKLINDLKHLQSKCEKPIISTYPYGFEFEDEKPVVKIEISDKTTLVLKPHPETDLTQENVVLRFRAEHVFTRDFIPGFHVAGGFIFTLGSFIDEVPYDPHLYFHGEEQNLAARAYTHGWDIFHPPVIPLYHLYKTPETEHKSHHWHHDWESERDVQWTEREAHAAKRLNDLLYQNKSLGAFGLGQQRNLQDFAEFSGVDYPNRCLRENVKPKVES